MSMFLVIGVAGPAKVDVGLTEMVTSRGRSLGGKDESKKN